MSKVRVGFIGAGRIADLHARAYEANPTGELVAIADNAPGFAAKRADEFGASKAFTDYRELLADPEIDAVEILLPHHVHAEIGIEALAAGKHVSLQKPMGITAEQADQVVCAVSGGSANRVFRVFDNFLSYPPYRLAKKLIEAGEIGDPVQIRMQGVNGNRVGGWEVSDTTWAWRMDERVGGGPPALIDHGSHFASSITNFMGPVKTVHVFNDFDTAAPGAYRGSPAAISFRFESGALGTWTMTRAKDLHIPSDYYPGDELLEIIGAHGIVWVNRCSGKLLDRPPVMLFQNGTTRSFEDVEVDWGESFRIAGMEFTDAIANGGEIGMSAERARGVLAFQFSAMCSAEEHREVNVSEF